MWRGYQTRNIINYYTSLLNKKRPPVEKRQTDTKANSNETKKYKKPSRQLSDLVDMQKTQKIPSWSFKPEIE
jgi:hypothetical protein